MLKKTVVLVAAALVAPTVASIVVGGFIGAAELKYKLQMKKLDAQTAAKK